MKKKMDLVTIGYAKQALIFGTREQKRLSLYARELGTFHVIVFTKRTDGFLNPVAYGNLMVYPTHSRTRIGMLYDALRIGRKILKDKSKDTWLISSQDPFETSLVGRLLARMTGVKHHVQVHGDNFGAQAWRRESILNRGRYFFGLYILRTASHIRVVSKRIRDSLVHLGIEDSRITMLPIRPELETFLSSQHFVKNAPPFTFLFIGRLAPEKNISLILESFSKLVSETAFRDRVLLRIVGKGPLESYVRSYCVEHDIGDIISLVPWTEEVETQMASADVFLLASHHEAYALTLIEAMAVGLPIITTDVGCVGEVVKDRVHGIVVYEKTVSAYVAAMEEMLSDSNLRNVYSKNGKDTAKIVASQTVEQYVYAWVQSFEKAL